jgi:hypothetical protein
MAKINLDFCISSYLAFRYVAKPGISWKEGVLPAYPDVKTQGKFKVNNAQEVQARLREIIQNLLGIEEVGILLSAGMDSAIIAGLLPKGTRAYTVRFVAKNAIDESPAASRVAEKLGLNHKIIDVTWDDYSSSIDGLMKHKKAPLHPAEAGIYKAACVARQDGVKVLAVGNGADSTFGGMDKLLSKDWTFDEFVARYTFMDPVQAVKKPVSIADIYEPYRLTDGVDVVGFLKTIHGLGVIQMFENAIHAGGCRLIAPFEELALAAPLDISRIRSGEPKYILNEVFRAVCPGFVIPSKIPFARPMTQWLAGWSGPRRPEFIDDLTMNRFTGEQKWLLYCLERFLCQLDGNAI